MLTWMPKSSCSGTHSCSQRVHGSQTLLKSARHHFYPDLSLSQDKLSWKTSLWIRSKMVGLFLNTSTADHMYSAHTSEKIQQQVQTQLSWNWKTIPHIAIPFLKSTWNSALLKKKDQLDRSNILEVTDSEKFAYLNAKKLFFQNTLLESTCSRILNTAQNCAASVLS